MTREDLETASLEDLLEFHNANSKKKIKQWPDRPTAIEKVGAIIDKLEAKAAEEAAPKPEPTPEELEAKALQIKENRSNGTKRSWDNEETREKRKARHGVLVDGQYYKSVGEAFRELGLPLNQRISFRIELKLKGEDREYKNPVTGELYHWQIVDYRKTPPKPKAKKEKQATEATEDTAPAAESDVTPETAEV